MKTILCVVGTRPEVIKMAPVILGLKAQPDRFRTLILATAQHRGILDQMLTVFGLVPDHDLNVMTVDQSLTDVTVRVLKGVGDFLDLQTIDMLVVQGDTTTTFASALAAFYRKVPIAHVEAGLRTHKRYYPFPEELNRCLTTRLASLHFAPSVLSASNLRAEGVPSGSIRVTGNPVIDALAMMVDDNFIFDPPLAQLANSPRLVVVTLHRRENFGPALEEAFAAIGELAASDPELRVVFPVHPNPNVHAPAHRILGGAKRVHLVEPLPYKTFCNLMARATLLITDSGGMQEEGPYLKKPVLVLRDETERPEAVTAGTVQLVGCHRQRIFDAAQRLLTDRSAYRRMAQSDNPYGDGTAADQIVAAIDAHLYSDQPDLNEETGSHADLPVI